MAWSRERKAKFRAAMAAKRNQSNGAQEPSVAEQPLATLEPAVQHVPAVIVSVRAGSQMTITLGQMAVTVVATP